jgi:hypothetical protein
MCNNRTYVWRSLILGCVLAVFSAACIAGPKEDLVARGYGFSVPEFCRAASNGDEEAVDLFIGAGHNVKLRESPAGDCDDYPENLAEKSGHTKISRKLRDMVDLNWPRPSPPPPPYVPPIEATQANDPLKILIDVASTSAFLIVLAPICWAFGFLPRFPHLLFLVISGKSPLKSCTTFILVLAVSPFIAPWAIGGHGLLLTTLVPVGLFEVFDSSQIRLQDLFFMGISVLIGFIYGYLFVLLMTWIKR